MILINVRVVVRHFLHLNRRAFRENKTSLEIGGYLRFLLENAMLTSRTLSTILHLGSRQSVCSQFFTIPSDSTSLINLGDLLNEN